MTFVTAHVRAGEALDLDWSRLATSGSTVAVYMGRAAVGEVSRQLIGAAPAADTPVMVAVNISLPAERIIHGRLSAPAFLVQTISDNDPSLLIIVEAVAKSSSDRGARAEAIEMAVSE